VLLKTLILCQLISWYWISGSYKVWTPLSTFDLFHFDFRSLIWYLSSWWQTIVILSIIYAWHMPQTLGWITVSKLLLVRDLIFNCMRWPKSLSATSILYYISIYLLNFMILRKLWRWILLVNTLSLIHLIKVILLKIVSLLWFDQSGKLIWSFDSQWSLINWYFIILYNSFRNRWIELYKLRIIYI